MVSKEIKKLSEEYLEFSLTKEGQKIMRENRKCLLKEYKNQEGIFSEEENIYWEAQK